MKYRYNMENLSGGKRTVALDEEGYEEAARMLKILGIDAADILEPIEEEIEEKEYHMTLPEVDNKFHIEPLKRIKPELNKYINVCEFIKKEVDKANEGKKFNMGYRCNPYYSYIRESLEEGRLVVRRSSAKRFSLIPWFAFKIREDAKESLRKYPKQWKYFLTRT
jgi:hypothetical protein